MLQPRKLVLDRLMLDFQLGESRADLSFSDRSRVTSPIKSRTTPISSAGVRRSSESGACRGIQSLNHIFNTPTSP
jgi:hypothetical protein